MYLIKFYLTSQNSVVIQNKFNTEVEAYNFIENVIKNYSDLQKGVYVARNRTTGSPVIIFINHVTQIEIIRE